MRSRMDRNPNGLTLSEWVAAAGGYQRLGELSLGEAMVAWEKGEDPSDYRAAPADYEPCGTCGYDHEYDDAYSEAAAKIEKAHS